MERKNTKEISSFSSWGKTVEMWPYAPLKGPTNLQFFFFFKLALEMSQTVIQKLILYNIVTILDNLEKQISFLIKVIKITLYQ